MIPVTKVEVPEAAESMVLEVLRSGQLAQGKYVEQLEVAFAASCGASHAVVVSNGTVALQLAALAMGIGPGDEVITSPFTFVATVNSIIATGARVRFVDIDPETFCMDADRLTDAITPATAAIVPVHLYGLPADMDALTAVAEQHGLAVIQDAAQAHGAAVGSRIVGSAGTAAFSLYATKNMTAGEGGIVTTDDDGLADRLRLLRNQGMRQRYGYEVVGMNARMTELQAAVGLAELSQLEERTKRRQQNAARLSAGLSDIDDLIIPVVPEGRSHVFHQYTVRISAQACVGRDHVADRLHDRGVGSGIYYPKTILGYECFREHPSIEGGSFAEAERAASEVLSLPVHPFLSEKDLDTICTATRNSLLVGT